MPDPSIYLTALVATIVTSVVGCLLARVSATRFGVRAGTIAVWLAITASVVTGALLLGLPMRWPPTSGLGRLLVVVLPSLALLECVAVLWASFQATPIEKKAVASNGWRWRHGPWVLTAPWVLWWGSVYSPKLAWTNGAGIVASVSAFLIVAMLFVVMVDGGSRLSEIVGRRAVLMSTSVSLGAAGMLIAMAGYLQGAAAALPLAGALIGPLLIGSVGREPRGDASGVVAWSGACLWGTLFVGRFFGAITTLDALAVALAPSLGWIGVFALRRGLSPRQAIALSLVLAAIILASFVVWGGLVFRLKLGKLV